MTTYTRTLSRDLTLTEYVGARIREERKKRGWNQTELGRRMGVSTAWVSDLERLSNNMTFATLEKVVDAFEIPVRELLP